MFRKMRGVDLPEKKQGLLFFVCQNYEEQPERVRQRIRRLCDRISGGEEAYRAALFDMLTTRESVTALSLRHNVSAAKLYDLRREFYEAWYHGKT